MANKPTNKTTIEIIQIINAGGSVMFDASYKTSIELAQIASAAAQKGVNVTFLNVSNKTTLELVQIANAGKNKVTLEI